MVLPILFNQKPFGSVLDVGCGLGTWLASARDLGVTDLVGLDFESMDPSLLAVPSQLVSQTDLRRPLSLGRRFDLVICLEVAEHLPEKSADTLVESLIRHTDRILFSAAIPEQGGQDHVNEQWPSYWAAKFARHGFVLKDSVRPLVWEDTAIEWWYRQNMLMAERGGILDSSSVQRIIHPEMFQSAISVHQSQIQRLMNGELGIKVALSILARTVTRRLQRVLKPAQSA